MVTTTRKQSVRFLERFGALFGLLAIILVLSILSPSFLSLSNLLNVLRQVSINALIAFGMTFVILTGGIDLSVGSILALSSAIVAQLLASGMSFIPALFIGLLVGALLGLFNGLVITQGKVAPFIVTLATMTVYRGLTLVYTDGRPITNMGDDLAFQMFGRGYFFGIPVPVITMLITFILLYFLLKKTTLGRKTYAIGGNEEAAILAGIRVSRVKWFVYTLAGLLSALAGVILTSRLHSAEPTAGTSYELDAIAAVVLGGTSLSGGKGSIVGTMIGALIIGTLNNGLNLLGVSSFYQLVVKGLVILIAILLDRKSTS
ncbi:ribose ABC transporter permease [Polycladomyces subterraneus]|uniref:Ribose ABC transporter permease n=1 Tax=Polycladomyces subterraneus TaxID=1016997 RepID=A0ABT8IMM3_9BACL|nr:ribose ABC transporter permease [Polycladomyces subterraneus]MDN4593980.1 ribose ABC transporter permease [Polycladomyces subterraneus]